MNHPASSPGPSSFVAVSSPHSPAPNPQEVQTFWVMRHGDRLDSFDRTWKSRAKYREDTPLSPRGHVQAAEVAAHLLKHDKHIKHILSSPFLRAIETSVPLSKQTGILIKLEKSVWETGCRHPPPPHWDEGFPLDRSGTYESAFEPTCGERPPEFRARLARAAAILSHRFPVGSGNVAIFSHADPVAYLVTELCGIDPTLTGPIAPACIFRLERKRGERKFRIVVNAGIDHLSLFGKTEPCHPIHRFHDWCRLFEEMRQEKRVAMTFRWPPEKHEMAVFVEAWHARYTRLLREGKSKNFPVIGPPHKKSKKIKFNCMIPQCQVTSYIKESLYQTAPPSHVIHCWKCKGSFLLIDIPRPPPTDQTMPAPNAQNGNGVAQPQETAEKNPAGAAAATTAGAAAAGGAAGAGS